MVRFGLEKQEENEQRREVCGKSKVGAKISQGQNYKKEEEEGKFEDYIPSLDVSRIDARTEQNQVND